MTTTASAHPFRCTNHHTWHPGCPDCARQHRDQPTRPFTDGEVGEMEEDAVTALSDMVNQYDLAAPVGALADLTQAIVSVLSRYGIRTVPQAEVTVQWEPASEPGALDHWTLLCSRCGPVVGGSALQGMANSQARGHEAWHDMNDVNGADE